MNAWPGIVKEVDGEETGEEVSVGKRSASWPVSSPTAPTSRETSAGEQTLSGISEDFKATDSEIFCWSYAEITGDEVGGGQMAPSDHFPVESVDTDREATTFEEAVCDTSSSSDLFVDLLALFRSDFGLLVFFTVGLTHFDPFLAGTANSTESTLSLLLFVRFLGDDKVDCVVEGGSFARGDFCFMRVFPRGPVGEIPAFPVSNVFGVGWDLLEFLGLERSGLYVASFTRWLAVGGFPVVRALLLPRSLHCFVPVSASLFSFLCSLTLVCTAFACGFTAFDCAKYLL